MLGLFVDADGRLSILDGDHEGKAPERVLHPDESRGVFHLLATDAVLVNDEALLVAFYEEKPPTIWERAIRKEIQLHQNDEKEK